MDIYNKFYTSGYVNIGENQILKQGLFSYNKGDSQKYLFKECYAEMTLSLTDFANPLSDRYSKLEYIELYVRLLQKLGLVIEISSISTTNLKIIIDYSQIEHNEVSFLKLNWQTIRNLHLNYTAHVPARFIELFEIFPEKDLFLLLQIAYRLVPYDTIAAAKGPYDMSSSNPVFSFQDKQVLLKDINLNLNCQNYRKVLSEEDNLTHILQSGLNNNGESQLYGEEEYNQRYQTIIESTTKEELWSNIENIIFKKQTKKQEEKCLPF